MTALRFNQSRLTNLLAGHSTHFVSVLEGAFHSFEDTENPVRFANTANTLREIFPGLMKIIAPDKEIAKSCWFVPDKTSRNGITRRHRCQFSVYRYVAPQNFAKNFAQSVENLTNKILQGIDDLNALAHITPSSLGQSEADAVLVFTQILENFELLFETIDHGRKRLSDSLHATLHEVLDDLFTSEFFDSLDQLSTHTRPQGAADIEVEIDDLNESEIHFIGTGTVECDLQYGSDGDCDRGDGLEWSDDFPFTFSGSTSVADLKCVSVDSSGVSINTDKYFEADDAC